MEGMKVVPFEALSAQERAEYQNDANWKVDGDGSWMRVVDTRYGNIIHTLLTDENGNSFDKAVIEFSPAVFVVTIRINDNEKAELLLPNERRPVLIDEEKRQGNVSIPNIPQGLVKTWKNETPVAAAKREVEEETGHIPIGIAHIGNVYIDAANSPSMFPFFIALVPYEQNPIQQNLDISETITPNWYTWKNLDKMPIQDAKTLIGLRLAERVLDQKLIT